MSELKEVLNTPEPGCIQTVTNNCKLLITPSVLTERMLQQLQCSLGVASQYANSLEVADLLTEGDAGMKKAAEEQAIGVMKQLQNLLSESLQVEQIKLQVWMIKNAKKAQADASGVAGVAGVAGEESVSEANGFPQVKQPRGRSVKRSRREVGPS